MRFGAKGDGATDDRAAVQGAIDAAIRSPVGGIVYFPPGTYRIVPIEDPNRPGSFFGLMLSDPLAAPAVPPYACPTLLGAGAFPNDPRSPGAWTGPRSTIILEPTDDGQVLLRWWRTGGGVIENLAFLGRLSVENESRAGTLIETRGQETANTTFRNMHLVDADVGIDHRTAVDDEDLAKVNSDMIYERLMLENLGVGCRTHHAQNLNYRFQMLYAKSCDTVLKMLADEGDPNTFRNAGGLINVDTALFDACATEGGTSYAIELGEAITEGGETQNHGGGPLTRVHRFTNVRVINNVQRVMKVRGDWVIAMEGFHESQASQGAELFDLQNCGVAFEQSTFETQPLLAWADKKTTVRFRDCRFAAASWTRSAWIPTISGDRRYAIDWCDLSNNVPISNEASTSIPHW